MSKISLVTLIFASVLFSACAQNARKEFYGTLREKEVFLITLVNKEGNSIQLSNYGARIVRIEVPDKSGIKENITLGYDTFEGMISGEKSFGAIIGRFAGGTGGNRFNIDGTEYTLPDHSSPLIWQSVVWNTEIIRNSEFPAVRFTWLSPDMEEGFPGTINVAVTYTWTDDNEIIIDYLCSADMKSILNITNHAYFNLHGAGNGDILDHELIIKASSFTPIDSMKICTGEIRKVEGTPFDFKTPHLIGERINDSNEQIIEGNGYDHNFVLDNMEEPDASVYDPHSGRFLEVITDQPGIVLYTGNYLDGTAIGYDGKPYTFRSGVCLETGHFPDSPIRPGFPSAVISPDKSFKSRTIYRFSVK